MSDELLVRYVDLANKRLNSKEDFENFQKFVDDELGLDTISSMIDEKIDCEEGPKVLEYILVGLSVKPDSQQIIEQVYEYVLNAINTSEISEKIKVCLISRLSLQLNKLSTNKLIKFIDMCKKDIEDSNENSMQSWKELIPQIFKVVSEIKMLTVDGIEMTGLVYKENIITDICHYKVQTNIVVALAAMFRRTQLNDKEHDLVIKTLCSYIGKLKPQEIPPLLQQILHFCSSGEFLNLFCTLQKYFDDKYLLYQTDNTNNELQIESEEKKELLEAQKTILFLLEDFAILHSSFVDDITKHIKNSIGAPNMVLGSFMMAFLLTMSCCTPYETIIIDLVKKLVIQSFTEEENTERSCWLKSICPDNYSVLNQFKTVVTSEISSYEKVLNGLVNLSLSFLETNASTFKKNVDITNQVHKLGLYILIALVNLQPFIIKCILQKLTDSIISNPTSSQYIDCLHRICKHQTALVMENNTNLLKLFKEIPVGITDKVTYAVMPVLKRSTYLRDNVIIILRKELMSKDYQLRHCAILGFIEILCSVRLNNIASLSQNTNSEDSLSGLFTQVVLDRNSVDVHSAASEDNADNDKTICLEILNVLKICFYQKSEIKQTLYRGLIKATSLNNELCVCINSLLLDHMSIWCNRQIDNEKISLKFDKSIMKSKDDKSIIHEPMEELILLAQHVLKINAIHSNGEENPHIDELNKILNQLVNFYCECNTDEIKVNENDSLLDVMSNLSINADVIKQILLVYQALMMYVMNLWSNEEQAKTSCDQLLKLFSKYIRIIDDIMASSKNKKKDKGKTKKSESTGSPFTFTEPFICVDLKILLKWIQFLFGNVDCCNKDSSVLLKSNKRLWVFILRVLQINLTYTSNLLSQGKKPCGLYDDLIHLCNWFFKRFMFKTLVYLDFDPAIFEIGAACYLQVLRIVSFQYDMDTFLLASEVDVNANKEEQVFTVLFGIRCCLENVMEVDNDTSTNSDEDEDKKLIYAKIVNHLIGCASVLCRSIQSKHDPKIRSLLNWLSSAIERYTFESSNNVKDYLTIILDMHAKYEEDPITLAVMVNHLCRSFGRITKLHKEEQLHMPKIITTSNRTTICPILCQYLCSELNNVLFCLSRIKAELNMSKNNVKYACQDWIKTREKAICHRIVLVILSVNSLTKSVIPMGQPTESVFNVLYQVYRTINIVTKHFLARSSFQEPIYKQATLKKLSAIVNDQLSPNVSKFIMFVEHDRPLTEKEKKSNQLKNQTKRQASYIPKVVTELESFVNLITKLGKKCKDTTMLHNIKLTSSRDFRLNVQKLQDMLKKKNDSEESDEEPDATTSHNKSNASNVSGETPKKKKRKTESTRSSLLGSESVIPTPTD